MIYYTKQRRPRFAFVGYNRPLKCLRHASVITMQSGKHVKQNLSRFVLDRKMCDVSTYGKN